MLQLPESAVIYDKDRHTFVETPAPSTKTNKQKLPVKLGISNGVKN